MENRFVKMVVCGFCGNTLAVGENGLDPTGKTAKLAQTPTRFSVGATGSLRGMHYRVLGRVRYADDESFWDEWYLELSDGSIAWLEEEEGQYTLSHAQPLTSAVPSYEEARVGSTINVSGQAFFVTERCTARIAGAEGQLFFRATPGRTVRFVDGNVGGRTAAIEYGEDEIELVLGEPLRRSDITVDGEAS